MGEGRKLDFFFGHEHPLTLHGKPLCKVVAVRKKRVDFKAGFARRPRQGLGLANCSHGTSASFTPRRSLCSKQAFGSHISHSLLLSRCHPPALVPNFKPCAFNSQRLVKPMGGYGFDTPSRYFIQLFVGVGILVHSGE